MIWNIIIWIGYGRCFEIKGSYNVGGCFEGEIFRYFNLCLYLRYRLCGGGIYVSGSLGRGWCGRCGSGFYVWFDFIV